MLVLQRKGLGLREMPEHLIFTDIRVGKYFVCKSFQGKFLKVAARSAFSFLQNVTHKIPANERVSVIPIQIEIADKEQP